MTQIEIYPNGAGTASSSVSGHVTEFPYSYSGWWTGYLLSATPNPGFAFSHFEIVVRYVSSHVEDTSEHSSYENPSGGSTEYDFNDIFSEHYISYDHIEYFSKKEIIKVRAVFYDDRTRLVTYKSPSDHAGTTTGDGFYVKGTSTVITATKRCSPWEFNRWEIKTLYPDPPSLIVSYEAETVVAIPEGIKEIFCTAFFDHSDTKQIICDSQSGDIVCSKGGNLLYDG